MAQSLFIWPASLLQRIMVSYVGDSIVKQVLPTWPEYVPTYSAFLSRSINTINYGVSGQRASAMVTAYPTGAHTNRPFAAMGDQGWLCLQGGGNDISDGVTATTVQGYLASVWASARSDGYAVAALTVLPRGSWGSGSEQAWTDLNNLIISTPNLYDVLIRADLVLPDPHNTDWYYDTTHPTVLGAQMIADAVATAIG